MSRAVIDFRKGEAGVVLSILIELSKHREPPITALGSQLERRPTINVTLTKSIGDEDVAQEYRTGRSTTIKGHCNHETEHFSFEWLAPS